MHSYAPWAIALVVVAFASIPAALVLPWISVFAAKPRTSLVFAAYTGGCGLLALGIAQLARTVVGPNVHRSDYHGTLAFALGIGLVTFAAACLMAGRALTVKRSWKVLGSAALLAVGADFALGCLLVHQYLMADHYRRASESGLIFAGLFGGIPVAVVGLALLARTSAKVARAEEAAVSSAPPPSEAPPAPAAASAAG